MCIVDTNVSSILYVFYFLNFEFNAVFPISYFLYKISKNLKIRDSSCVGLVITHFFVFLFTCASLLNSF